MLYHTRSILAIRVTVKLMDDFLIADQTRTLPLALPLLLTLVNLQYYAKLIK